MKPGWKLFQPGFFKKYYFKMINHFRFEGLMKFMGFTDKGIKCMLKKPSPARLYQPGWFHCAQPGNPH